MGDYYLNEPGSMGGYQTSYSGDGMDQSVNSQRMSSASTQLGGKARPFIAPLTSANQSGSSGLDDPHHSNNINNNNNNNNNYPYYPSQPQPQPPQHDYYNSNDHDFYAAPYQYAPVQYSPIPSNNTSERHVPHLKQDDVPHSKDE
ncbi:unnamed protein product [Cunninghamella blakesleeana]